MHCTLDEESCGVERELWTSATRISSFVYTRKDIRCINCTLRVFFSILHAVQYVQGPQGLDRVPLRQADSRVALSPNSPGCVGGHTHQDAKFNALSDQKLVILYIFDPFLIRNDLINYMPG